MKIALIARSTLYTIPGGDTVQVDNTAACLRELCIEADIRLCHEPIDYNVYDLLHFFNIGRPADILHHISRAGKPVIITPNLVDYSEYDKYHRKGITGFLLSFLSPGRAEYLKTIARWLLGKDKLVSKHYLWKGHDRSIRCILEKAAMVLPGSMMEYENLVRRYKTKPSFKLVFNGVDTSLFSCPPPSEKEENIVLCAARIEGIKNQLNLIRALNNTAYKLVLVGSPAPNQLAYYRKCRKLAAKNIVFLEHLPQQDLLSWYRKAKVHILPSWFETCGLSSLEAAMTGCNVVITRKGYANEYFEDHAVYCDPSSPDSIRRAVEKAFTANSTEQLRSRIVHLYTWPLAAAAIKSAYTKVINKSGKLRIGILGTRGIPNHYGGFEQFAENLSKGLTENGHEVTVYNSHNHPYQQNTWGDVRIVHRYDPESLLGTFGQFLYDLNCILDARKRHFDIILMLGYTSSAVWGPLYPKNATLLFNMDGLEWQRTKYKPAVRKFLQYAEKLAIRYGDYHIADSPVVQRRVREKYHTDCHYIGYGAEILDKEDESILEEFRVGPYGYFMLMARLEPENNIEMILEGFSASTSNKKFLVIGNTANKTGKHLLARFGHDKRILFAGSIFNNPRKIHTLKKLSYLYFHGHSVGGTNPSLLEAMASRALIAAHDNPFNRAVLHKNAFYFSGSADITQLVERINRGENEQRMTEANIERIRQEFTWERITQQYEAFFFECLHRAPVAQPAAIMRPVQQILG